MDYEQFTEFNTLDHYEHNTMDLELDIDPDINLFSNINNSCKYYTTEEYNHNIKADGKLSIIHINSRSLYANFKSIKNYLYSHNHSISLQSLKPGSTRKGKWTVRWMAMNLLIKTDLTRVEEE